MCYTYTIKQANVIRRAWEEGKLEISEEGMDRIYRFANGGVSGFRNSDFSATASMRSAVDAVFRRDYEAAQRKVNSFMKDTERYRIA